MPTVNTCQFCGAQSTTLESYFQWIVCSGCASELRAPQGSSASTEEPTKPAKRARCNCCSRLEPREQLTKFTHKIDSYQATYGNKLVCLACERAMLTPCKVCGTYLHASDINDAYANGVCFDCRAKAERERARRKHEEQERLRYGTCRTCGRHGYLYATPSNAYEYVACASCFLRETRQFFTREDAATGQHHARILAEHAGERLEWPCSPEELKRVWRSAARRTHPDTGGSTEAFRTAKESYDALVEVL